VTAGPKGRRATATDLQTAEALQRFKKIVSGSHDMLALLDSELTFLVANSAFLDAFGITADELIGHTIEEAVGAEFFSTVDRSYSERCLMGHHVSYQQWFEFPTAGRLYMDIRYVPDQRSDGTVIGISVAARDITQLKQSQEAERAISLQWKTLVNTLPTLIWLKAPDGRYLSCNQAYQRDFLARYDIPADTCIIGKRDHDFIQAEIADVYHQQNLAVMREDTPSRYERETHSLLDDQLLTFELTKVAMREEDGSLIGVLGIEYDITTYKRQQRLIDSQVRRNEALLRIPRLAEEMDEAAFLQQSVNILERLTASHISFLHFLKEDQSHIELSTWSSQTLDDYCTAMFDQHYPISQAGIWADAARSRKPVVFNDYPNLAPENKLPDGHAKLDRLISVPVIDQDRVVMLVGVGNKDTAYSDYDVETAQLIANEIWRIVDRGRMENKAACFSRLLERSLNEIYFFDNETLRFIDVNLGARTNLGYSLEELRKLTPVDIKPEFTLGSFTDLIAPLRSGTRQELTFTTMHRRKDGTRYPVEVHMQLMDEEKPIFVAIVRNIVERVKIESELKKLALAVEQSPVSVMITNLGAEIEYVNDTFISNTGYSREEVIGENPRLLQSGRTPADSYVSMWDALTSGRPWQGEFCNRRKDGSEFIEMVNIAPLIQSEGQATHYIAVKQDITAQKQLDAEIQIHRNHLEELVAERTEELAIAHQRAESVADDLRASEDRFKHAAHAAKLGHWGFDEVNDIFTYASEEFARLYGYTLDDFMARFQKPGSDWRLIHPDDRARVLEVYNSQDEAVVEFRMIHRDGSIRHMRESFTSTFNDAGTLLATEGTLQDITHSKLLEIELRKALEAADAASRAKSTFLANMSHEIRTPMNAIIGLAHLLQHSEMTVKQKSQLEKIDGSAQHLLSIINDILDLSKIEAGKLTLEHKDFHLDQIFNYIQSLFMQRLAARGLALEIDCNIVPAWFCGDVTRVRQALINYVDNAIKFSEHGTIILRASKLEDNEAQARLHFEVQDNGIGIEPDKLPSLFDAFDQADTSITRQYGGTGLGLSITRQIAQLMGGDAGVNSEPGKGSTFWFSVWLEHSQGRMPAELPARSELGPQHAGSHILLADDNDINRDVAQALLSSRGLDVDTAKNGQEAVAMARHSNYDLILMDVQMPGYDGLQATRVIRSGSKNPDVPILALTANVFAEDRNACIEAGMNDFIAKPFKADELFSMIAHWLPQQPLPEASTERPAGGGGDQAVERVTADSAIDPQVLEDLLGDDVKAHAGLLRKFHRQAETIVAEVETACQQRNRQQLLFLAHKFKSSAQTVGAHDLARLCLAMEAEKSVDDWRETDQLSVQMGLALECLTAYIENL